MVTSSKSLHKLLIIILFVSCETDAPTDLTRAERKALSEDMWHKEEAKHGFNFAFQGTPKGETLLDSILALDPDNCKALRAKSVPYLKRGLPHLWKPQFDAAVNCDPATWQPMRGYLYLYFYRDYDKAIADFNASDTLTPHFIDAPQGQSVNYWRGLAYIGKSDYENAVDFLKTHIETELEEASEEWIETSTFLYLGIAQYELKQYGQAKNNLMKMVDYNGGNSADANYYLALTALKMEDYEQARIYANTARTNYKDGYFRYRSYVEEIRQIYPENLVELASEIEKALR